MTARSIVMKAVLTLLILCVAGPACLAQGTEPACVMIVEHAVAVPSNGDRSDDVLWWVQRLDSLLTLRFGATPGHMGLDQDDPLVGAWQERQALAAHGSLRDVSVEEVARELESLLEMHRSDRTAASAALATLMRFDDARGPLAAQIFDKVDFPINPVVELFGDPAASLSARMRAYGVLRAAEVHMDEQLLKAALVTACQISQWPAGQPAEPSHGALSRLVTEVGVRLLEAVVGWLDREWETAHEMMPCTRLRGCFGEESVASRYLRERFPGVW